MRTFEAFRERKLERMRLGQAVCEYVTLLSDDEIRLAIVPLTDAEYQNSLSKAMHVEAFDNEHGMLYRDRIQQNSILLHAAREPDDLTKRFFEKYEEVAELESHDVNHIWDHYREMVAQTSPEIDGVSEEDFSELKKAFNNLTTSDLSGRQWYALKRFLLSLTQAQLLDKSLGFSSISPSITTKESSSEPATDVDQSGTS